MIDAHASIDRVLPASRLPRRRPLRAIAGHLLRVLLFVAIVLLIRLKHGEYRAEQTLASTGEVPPALLSPFYAGSPRTGQWDLNRGAQIVTDQDGETLGFVVQTSPDCNHIIGYLGPTNVLIAFDSQYRVIGIDVLTSGDTVEHLEKVTGDRRFMNAYRGLSWHEAAGRHDIDAVSGATLTSLAIVESISHRLGDPCPSLRFPDKLSVSEIAVLFSDAATIRQRIQQPLVYDVLDAQGQPVGAVVRTSPTCDGLAGYQGPTDALIALDNADRVVRIAIRSSFDNQPYVRYVQEDDYFGTLFQGLSLAELAQFDLESAEVEGVSGATMTSMAVARSLLPASAAALARHPNAPRIIISARDVGTCVILLGALVLTFTHLRGRPRVRNLFRVTLVVYLGFLNGDILSQALLVGWAQSGVPWRLAPGLVLLTAAALLVPIGSKRQLYCHHLCPFGAAQQLIRASSPWRQTVPRSVHRFFVLLPPILLLTILLAALLHLPWNLASFEPFHAFVFWIAGPATLVIAAVGLIASIRVPMAYCRYGCPTGSLLGYLRLHGRSEQLSRRDLFAVGLLVLALML